MDLFYGLLIGFFVGAFVVQTVWAFMTKPFVIGKPIEVLVVNPIQPGSTVKLQKGDTTVFEGDSDGD